MSLSGSLCHLEWKDRKINLVDTPGDADRKIGLFLGLIACAGIAVGGYLTMQETSGGERY